MKMPVLLVLVTMETFAASSKNICGNSTVASAFNCSYNGQCTDEGEGYLFNLKSKKTLDTLP